jgi:hypothetical protein
VLSRTVGLPGMEIEEWLTPTGVFSLIVEGIFMILVALKRPWEMLPGLARPSS